MIVGFTGSRDGMSAAQRSEVAHLLWILSATEFHHGDCVGADEIAHSIAVVRKVNIVIHPPTSEKLRAHCSPGKILPAKEFIKRNHDIVNVSDILIATPKEMGMIIRSGTWATIRYAISKKKIVIVVFHDGAYALHNADSITY
jgi:hypothetical protein